MTTERRGDTHGDQAKGRVADSTGMHCWHYQSGNKKKCCWCAEERGAK